MPKIKQDDFVFAESKFYLSPEKYIPKASDHFDQLGKILTLFLKEQARDKFCPLSKK